MAAVCPVRVNCCIILSLTSYFYSKWPKTRAWLNRPPARYRTRQESNTSTKSPNLWHPRRSPRSCTNLSRKVNCSFIKFIIWELKGELFSLKKRLCWVYCLLSVEYVLFNVYLLNLISSTDLYSICLLLYDCWHNISACLCGSLGLRLWTNEFLVLKICFRSIKKYLTELYFEMLIEYYYFKLYL